MRVPQHFDFRPHLEKAGLIIKNYTTIFMLNGDMLGSGVCVQTCGLHGILTAHHVAEGVLRNSDFALYVGESEESEWAQPSCFDPVPIGCLRSHADQNAHEKGPDLSFLIILKGRLLETLKLKKPFYSLDAQRTFYFSKPLDGMPWAVAGSPYERCRPVRYDFEPDGALTKVRNLVAWGGFKSHAARDGFDYIKLEMPCDEEPFPASYDGMSGGGLWAVPLEIDGSDMSTVGHGSPLLGGIQFYESEPNDGSRTLTGHGFDSIYSRVRKTLKEKQVGT